MKITSLHKKGYFALAGLIIAIIAIIYQLSEGKKNEIRKNEQVIQNLIQRGMAQEVIGGFPAEEPFYLEALKLDPDNEELIKFYNEKKAKAIEEYLEILSRQNSKQNPTIFSQSLRSLERIDPENPIIKEYELLIEDYHITHKAVDQASEVSIKIEAAYQLFAVPPEQRIKLNKKAIQVLDLCEVVADNGRHFEFFSNEALASLNRLYYLDQESLNRKKEISNRIIKNLDLIKQKNL